MQTRANLFSIVFKKNSFYWQGGNLNLKCEQKEKVEGKTKTPYIKPNGKYTPTYELNLGNIIE